MTPEELERKKRAARRAETITISKGKLGGPSVDFSPVMGSAALSLATQLSRESFSVARLDSHQYSRAETPVRFVPRTRG